MIEMFDRPATAPHMEGRRSRLRSVSPADYDVLYRLETAESLGFRWRFRGATPSPDRFVQSLWDGVLATFVVARKSDGEIAGVVAAYDADHRNGFAYLAVVTRPGAENSGVVLEGAGLFIDYCLRMWNFRKLYAESLAFNFDAFGSGLGHIFREEGRLREHEFYNERYWDKVSLAVYRSDWNELRPTMMRRLLPLGNEV